MGIAQQLRQWGKATESIMRKLLPPEPGMEELAAAVGYIEYAGSPIGNVTPDFVGQVLFDTTNSQWYVAYGTTSSSWRMAAEWLIDSSGNFTGLTGPSGATISVSGAPKDLLSGTLQHVSITSAISTTAVASATASGTYYKARVAWNNNGASGSANLNIAVNCDNDVHGLRCGQNSKRRDYQMLMGSGVILISETPITTLHFSADSSITANTHLISVTFGN